MSQVFDLQAGGLADSSLQKEPPRKKTEYHFPCQRRDKEAFPGSRALSSILFLCFDALFGLQMYSLSKGSLLAEMSEGICYSSSLL